MLDTYKFLPDGRFIGDIENITFLSLCSMISVMPFTVITSYTGWQYLLSPPPKQKGRCKSFTLPFNLPFAFVSVRRFLSFNMNFASPLGRAV